MEEFKGTKGKQWTTYSTSLFGIKKETVAHKVYVGCVKIAECWRDTDHEYPNKLESLANAQLISAAPELLEALQHGLRLASLLENKESIAVKAFVRNAEKAISKALGQ